MARKIVSIPGLPQLPDSSTDKARYETDLLRVLWAWKRSLDQLIDENNTGDEGGGHIIQDEGVDLPDQDRLNFIGAAVTAADDPSNGRTNVTVTGGGGGSGTVTSITATSPIVVTPSPITATGDVSHANSGVTAGTYGDASHVPQIAVNAKGHVTAATDIVIPNNTGMTVGDSWLWGSGRDGVVHFNGTNTFSYAVLIGSAYYLKRCVHGTNVTIDSGIRVTTWDYSGSNVAGGGGQVYATGTLTVNGVLDANGGTSLGKANAGVATWSPYTTSAGLYAASGSGGTGGALIVGTNGGSVSNSWGGNGGAGGNGAAGGTAGGTAGTCTDPPSQEIDDNTLWTVNTMQSGSYGRITAKMEKVAGGAGGGGGGGGAGGWHGGAGGAGGSGIGVFARHIAGSGIISSDGGAGANGDWEFTTPGGGGGGGGGIVMCITATSPIPVTLRANGGAAGATSGTGNAGTAGSAGLVAVLYVGILA